METFRFYQGLILPCTAKAEIEHTAEEQYNSQATLMEFLKH